MCLAEIAKKVWRYDWYYYKDVLSILNNPILKPIYGQAGDRVRNLVDEKNLFYLTVLDILQDNNEDFIFQESLDRTPVIISCMLLNSLSGGWLAETGLKPIRFSWRYFSRYIPILPG